MELPHTKVLIYYCKSRYPEVTCSQNHWVSTSRSGGCATQNIKLNTWEWFVRRVEVAAHQHALFSNVAYNVWESISGRIILLLLLQFVAFGSLKHTPKLIVCRNLQHAWGTCMQNLWFSILIYHTWQAAAHQHIDCFCKLQYLEVICTQDHLFFIVIYSTGRLQHTQILGCMYGPAVQVPTRSHHCCVDIPPPQYHGPDCHATVIWPSCAIYPATTVWPSCAITPPPLSSPAVQWSHLLSGLAVHVPRHRCTAQLWNYSTTAVWPSRVIASPLLYGQPYPATNPAATVWPSCAITAK